jgi:hypothetical protein
VDLVLEVGYVVREICAIYVVSVFEGRCLILRCVSFVFMFRLLERGGFYHHLG